MDTLNAKINAFLRETGAAAEAPAANHVQLLRYFEREYDLQIMGMLEQEWLDEQIEHDLKFGYFRELRKQVADDKKGDFDRKVSEIFG